MKTIGLIGGMSWESSKVYYEYLNKFVKKNLGGSHSAKVLMTSVDFAEIKKLSFSNNWDKIGELMALEAKKLQAGGADVIVLGTNTIHLVSHHIEEATNLPFLHIAKATGEAIENKGIKKIGLIGTKFTMEKDFYTKILKEDYGIDTIIPEESERQLLQDIIYNELVKGIFTEKSKNTCLEIIKGLKENRAEGVILGCTELPILIPANEIDISSFDTTEIHSKKAVDFALN